jgi:polyferredoxin
MLINRQATAPHSARAIARLRETCMGCADCKGTCAEVMQMFLLPEILLRRRREGQP